LVKKYFLPFYGALNFPFFAFFSIFSIFFLKNSRKLAKKYFHKSKITKIATNHLYSTIKLFLWHLKIFSSFHHHVFKRSYGQKTAKNAIFGQLYFFFKKSYLENGASYGKSRKSIGKIFQTCDFCHHKISTKTRRCFSEAVFFSLKKGLSPPNGDQTKKRHFKIYSEFHPDHDKNRT